MLERIAAKRRLVLLAAVCILAAEMVLYHQQLG